MITVELCDKQLLNNVEVTPSTKVYFNRYPYKITFNGDKVNYDPLEHFVLNQFMFGEDIVDKREYWTYNYRCIFFRYYEDVKNICEIFSSLIKEVHGPVSNKHIKLLNKKVEIRKNLFFKKYDTKLEFCSDRGMRLSKKEKDKILKFVNLNFEDYRWFSGNFLWSYNYLYCTDKELKHLLPYLKLSCGEYLHQITQAHTYSDL